MSSWWWMITVWVHDKFLPLSKHLVICSCLSTKTECEVTSGSILHMIEWHIWLCIKKYAMHWQFVLEPGVFALPLPPSCPRYAKYSGNAANITKVHSPVHLSYESWDAKVYCLYLSQFDNLLHFFMAVKQHTL